MNTFRNLLTVALLALLPACVYAQTVDTTVVKVPYDSTWQVPFDSTFTTQHDTTVIVIHDTTVTVSHDTTATFLKDSLVIDTTFAPPALSHEPAGMRPIIDIDFTSTVVPTTYISAPNPVYGLKLGKVRTEPNARGLLDDGKGVHRCFFAKGSLAGKGVSCTLFMKENLSSNTDGTSVHSYRIWYDRAYMKFGNLDSLGLIQPVWESPSTDGGKLTGYWGVGCMGNINAIQIIGWSEPIPFNTSGVGKSVPNWAFSLRSQICGPTPSFYGKVSPKGNPGAWMLIEYLFDAGDVGVANGTAKMWVNGVLALDAKNLLMRTPSNPRGFFGRHWNPVQGGGCGTQPSCGRTTNGALDIDSYYASIAQPVD